MGLEKLPKTDFWAEIGGRPSQSPRKSPRPGASSRAGPELRLRSQNAHPVIERARSPAALTGSPA